MTKAVAASVILFLFILAGCAIFVSWRVGRVLESIDESAVTISNKVSSIEVGDLAGATDSLNKTLDALNAPCKDFQGNYTCGPIPQLSQTEKNIGILAAKSAQQVQQSATLVNSAASAITSATQDVHTMALAGTDALGEGKKTIAAAQPLLASLTRTADASTAAVESFNALVSSKDLADAIHHTAGITASGDTILANGAEVSTKMKDDYLKSHTPWGRIWSVALDTYDYGAAFARHY